MNRPAKKKAETSVMPSRAWLDMSDADLLSHCAVDVYRASGPGGQKRNKTSSAVRLRHQPTGLMVIAEESRSQQVNRTKALQRLRQAMALNLRNQINASDSVPEFFIAALGRDPTLRVSRKHADYWPIIQYVLDVLHAHNARVGEAAKALGVSTGHLVRFLKNDVKLWEQVNRLRAEFGHSSLQ